MVEILTNNKVDQGELLELLRKRLQYDRANFESNKHKMNELERAEQELFLSKTEFKITSLEKSFEENPDLKYTQVATEFLKWEPTRAREAINFLVTEFFTHSYLKNEWDKQFITDMVFEVSRVLTLIDQLERAKS